MYLIVLQYLALLHVSLLPGLIFLSLVPRPLGIVRVVYAFPLSLSFSFILSALLTPLGLYTREFLYFLCGVEILVIALWFSNSFFSWLKREFPRILYAFQQGKFFYSISIPTALFLIYLWCLDTRWAGAFDAGDDFVSWNPWALKWFAGEIPSGTYHYPQIVPTAWATIYKICGDQYQEFAIKLIQLFPISVFVLFLWRVIRFRSVGMLVAMPTLMMLYKIWVGWEVGSGYVDIPVSCISFIAFIEATSDRLTSFSKKASSRMGKYLFSLSALLFFAAANTKQAGWFILPMWILGAWEGIKIETRPSDRAIRLFIFVIFTIFISSIWYAYKEYQIVLGSDASEIGWVTNGIYKGKGVLLRIISALAELTDCFGYYTWISFILFVGITSLFKKVGRMPLWGVAFPYTLVWAMFFSYDRRNLTLALPFYAYGFGCCIDSWLSIINLTNLRSRIFVMHRQKREIPRNV